MKKLKDFLSLFYTYLREEGWVDIIKKYVPEIVASIDSKFGEKQPMYAVMWSYLM